MANLNPRQQQILGAVVNHYIATAEPVGSRVIAEGYKFRISPATIRNIMGVLEKSGLLYQPYTSAGRVPSDFGYRVYVDQLLPQDQDNLNFWAAKIAQRFAAIAHQNLEQLLKSTAQILATFSGCIALITSPNLQIARVRHVQIVLIDAETLMLILVTDSYHTTSVTARLAPDGNFQGMDLGILNNFLNTHLRDRQVSNLANLNWDELDQDFQHYAALLRAALQDLTGISTPLQPDQIFVSGLTELLRQPEFSQLSQVQSIIQLLEVEQALLLPLLFGGIDQEHLKIKIGSEIALEPIQNCTLISTSYGYDHLPVGSVGVLGPTRMDYERAIAAVQLISQHLSDSLPHWLVIGWELDLAMVMSDNEYSEQSI